MSDIIENLNSRQNDAEDTRPVEETDIGDATSAQANTDTSTKPKKRLTKNQIVIAAVAVVAIIAITFVIFSPSKFEKVKDECVSIAGMVRGSGDYFTIDTKPSEYDDMDPTVAALLLPQAQDNALEAIRYANEELGFSGSVYSDMISTTALMGRQSDENSKYKVSWTYHPDNGLEVTYTKK